MYASVVWKYPLNPHGATLSMPAQATILSVQVQGEMVLYALVNPDHPRQPRSFLVLATGERTTEALGPYIGTVEPAPGLWFHVFERARPDDTH